MTLAEELRRIFAARGREAYYGESVSMTDHSLQAAHFAQVAGLPAELVVAALLHDVGHLIDHIPADIADWTHDARHEELGGRWLARRFGPQVSEPVRLHVPAKRYLCATDSSYVALLSAASVTTLKLQGGLMSAEDIARFEAEPYHREALDVRRCDDRAKVAGLITPGLEQFLPMVQQVASGAAPSTPGGAREAQ